MACNASTCQSNCYRDEEQAREEAVDSSTNPIADDNNQNQSVCVKCKSNDPMSATGGDGGRLCADCFRSNLYGKFRLSVTSYAMISPTDNVLVAFSGGTSSRSLPVFGVGVVFIDEISIVPVPSHEINKAIQEIRLIVSNLAPQRKELHVVPIEDICSSNSSDGGDRLKSLLDVVSDATGREDLLLHLGCCPCKRITSRYLNHKHIRKGRRVHSSTFFVYGANCI
ncbi:hypothetical protein FH972_017749 [Carpinus fangiana]|uniref:Cytoplasmic tRNA 2-thiolation protein 2 n=1 Tax=Carpinus fangiana TaxID=176857 RepID=A0A5N6RN98_9ROSI|nr:hypothetical protein FH972_017749 [Carpinus fangiana]